MDKRNANSTFSQEVCWGRFFSFIKSHCYRGPKIGEALRDPGGTSRQRWVPETGSNYRHTKRFAVGAGSWSFGYHKQTNTREQTAAVITGLIIASWDLYWRPPHNSWERKKQNNATRLLWSSLSSYWQGVTRKVINIQVQFATTSWRRA